MSPAMRRLGGFDESRYLESNPDVLKAVNRGAFSSGWQHYVLFGAREHRPGTDLDLNQTIEHLLDKLDQSPPKMAPPVHLRERVHGVESLSSFESLGKIIALDIYNTLKTTSIELPEPARILDFGCGCGRVARYFHNLCGNAEFYGTDLDREAILWCRSYLSSIGQFTSNNEWPPLQFLAGYFDFVYAISVFTHLPEDMQLTWLEELARVTRPGGHLLLTVHGEQLLPDNAAQAKEELRQHGFRYAIGKATPGLPEFYQGAYHSEAYITSRWSDFFATIRVFPKALADHQDIVLCRR